MYPIHHSYGPHVTFRFWLLSVALLVQPWRWRTGSDRELLRQAVAESLREDVALFSTGREALLALLKALGIRSGEEIIIQAYTCIAVPNAIQAAGGVPVYADVDGDTLNLSIDAVQEVITPRTRAVIAQHTFGIVADLERLRKLCDEHDLILIEDCAHVLPDDPASPLARTGDYVTMSFGRDKAISGVTGGAVLSRIPDVSLKLKAYEKAALPLSLGTIVRLLLYPIIYAASRVLFCLGLGRITLGLCKALHLFVPITSKEEKRGNMRPIIHQLPNACAALALQSFRRLHAINDHRRMLTQFYMKESQQHGWNVIPGIHRDLPLQKFPLFFPNADAIRAKLKRLDIDLDDGWTGCTICPRTIDPICANYAAGTRPEAEQVGQNILSLPTHPTMTLQQARRLVRVLERALKELKVER